jgi:HSP20 family protein
MKALVNRPRRLFPTFEPFGFDLEPFFRPFFNEPWMEGNANRVPAWCPHVDVEEGEKVILVKVDLPGVHVKDLNLTVENGYLILRGVKNEEKEENKKHYHRLERYFGEFYREVLLPVGADIEKIVATSLNGVVTITIPKKPEVLPKKIAIKCCE